MSPIAAKIDVTKINKAWLFTGKTGAKYLDLTLRENKDGKGKYGDDGFVVQDPPKAERQAGAKGIIVGNWRHLEAKTQPKPVAPTTLPHKCLPTEADQPAEDDVPF